MDQTTHEIRLANWKSIIDSCQARPEGQTARDWLSENKIPEKQYYYYLRRLRKERGEELKALVPTVTAPAQTPLSFAEFPAEGLLSEGPAVPAVTIRTKKSTIEISSGLSEALVIRLVKAVAHAL